MRKFLAAVFAVVFILFMPLTFAATLIQYRIFQPEGIKTLLRVAQVGEQFPAIAGYFFSTQTPTNSDQDPFTQFGGKSVFTDTLRQVLPAQDAYAILDPSVDSIFAWWKTGEPIQQLPLVIHLSSAKQRLGPIIITSVRQRLDSLPECSAQQISDLQNQTSPDLFQLECKPQGFSFDVLAKAGFSEDSISQAALASIPDEFDIQTFLAQMELSSPQQFQQVNQNISQARDTLHVAWLILTFFQILSVVSFLAVGLIRLIPGRSFFSWVGWVLFLAGVELSVLGLGVLFLPQFLPLSEDIVPAKEILSAITHLFVPGLLGTGISMVVLGIGSIILSKILKHRLKKPGVV